MERRKTQVSPGGSRRVDYVDVAASGNLDVKINFMSVIKVPFAGRPIRGSEYSAGPSAGVNSARTVA